MSQIYESLKKLISPDMIAIASATVEEKSANVSTASSSIIAGLLAVMLKKGHSQQIKNILETAGNLNILNYVDRICEENPTQDQQRIGDDFLQHLLGDKAADFTDPIAKQSGISQVATNRLVSIIAPVVAGYLGSKLVNDNWSMTQLINEIDKEKPKFAGHIPGGVIKAFGLSSIVGEYAATGTAKETQKKEAPKKKKGGSWIAWFVLIVLLLLLLFWWKSCRNDRVVIESERTVMIDTIRNNSAGQQNNTANAASTITLTLPGGTQLNVSKGGVEEKIVNFLNSDEYKNAKDSDLQKKWFELNDVKFEFNSSTQLKSGSQKQLDNVAAILKAYKDHKIVVAAFADKKGTEEINMEISQERAQTIEKIFENHGIRSQIVKVEGHGDQYAKYRASASEENRAKDRDAAIRFVK